MGAIDVGRIRALTFDCYGTLIDWQTGILSAVRPVLVRLGRTEPDAAVLGRYAELERRAESGPYRPYKDILRDVMRGLAGDGADMDVLWRSIRDWPAFADTAPALARLKRRFRLGVASNIDDDLFEASRARLGVALDEVVTAQQVRSYKPGEAHFREIARRLGLEPAQILHVAESRFHDVEPASRLGFRTVWVNRAGGGVSASGPGGGEPDLVVRDLRMLADTIEVGLGDAPTAM